jgi:phospholipid/cholesterol/gamma-HCH transport system substrate-binding protein
MILTPMVKMQLRALAIATVIGCVILGTFYLRVPEAVGLNRYTVSVAFSHGAQLYDGAEVTYRGNPIGKVTDMEIAEQGIKVTLSLRDEVSVPDDVRAEIHSRSAVGEQYVDLVPPREVSSGRLSDGDAIPMAQTSTPIETGPLLDHVGAFVDSLPARDLNRLLRETGAAFRGRSEDLASLIDNSGALLSTAEEHLAPTRRLIRDFEPLAGAVNGTGAEFDRAAQQMAAVTQALRSSDQSLTALLEQGPGLASETTRLLEGVRESLPAMFGSLDVTAEEFATYNDGVENILSIYPGVVAMIQSITLPFQDRNLIHLDLANLNHPAACIEGFLPPQQWRDPADQSLTGTPRVYCKAGPSDPRVVKGARNLPCIRFPGVEAATPAECRRLGTGH